MKNIVKYPANVFTGYPIEALPTFGVWDLWSEECIHPKIIIGIDPGLNGTGVAVFREQFDSTHPRISRWILDTAFAMKAPNNRPYPGRALYIANKVVAALEDIRLSTYRMQWNCDCGGADRLALACAVIEEPSQWSGSGKSLAASASGDLIKLSYLIGSIAQTLSDTKIAPTTLIRPMDWKGQLSKPAANARIRRRLGNIPLENHSADAIGIGLHALGAF